MASKTRKGVSKLVYILATCVFFSFLSCSGVFYKTKTYIQYPIQPGDTLFDLSARFSVKIDEIQEVNGIRSPRSLKAGGMLKIPFYGQDISRRKGESDSRQVYKGARPSKKSPNQMFLGESSKYVGRLTFPVKDSSLRLSSRFGRRWLSFHEGIDISAKEGVPVYSAHSGRVVYSGSGIRGYGYLIVIKGRDLMTIYGHNRKNRVRVGELVDQGERIADLGQTGKASGPHVHFETRIKNKSGKYVAVDPLVFYPQIS